MNKFGKRLVVALMAASMLATPVYAAPNTDEIQAEKEQKEKEVQSVQAQLQTMVSKIFETEEKLITKGEEIQKAKEDLAEAEKKQEQQYESMKVRIKYMYEQGDTKALEDLFTSNSIADFLNQADYIETVHNYDREKLEEYVETKEQIASLKESLEKDLEKLEKMQASFESQKEALSETLTQKQAEVANLDQELQAAIAQAAAEEEARRKAAEEAQRKAAEEAASKESASNSNTTSGQGSTSGNQTSGNTASGNTTNRPSGGGTSNTNKNDTAEKPSTSKPSASKPSTGSGSNTSTSTGNTSAASRIVSAARSCLGTPYVWAGDTPGVGLDCSGLVKYCHSVAGISVARTSSALGAGGRAVSSPQPGDVVCYPGHVGIYIGGGQMIHAPQPGDVVKISSVYSCGTPWYRRYW